jgi:hypothetical protein
MKSLNCLLLVISVLVISCSCVQTHNEADMSAKDSNVAVMQEVDNAKNKEEIEILIRNVLKWTDSKQAIRLLPIIAKDSICTGFDLDTLKRNLTQLKGIGYFASEFIQNYNLIILTLDKKIKNYEFNKWNVYELPTFRFANDINPWCECQDNLDWNLVKVKIIRLSNDNGEMIWYWGNLNKNYDASWKDFEYKFRVVKEDGKWKIAYMEGFDFNESIRKDGK